MFVALLEEILPANFYSPSLTGIRVDTMILNMILKSKMGGIYNHFKNTGTDLNHFTSAWFMRLFIGIFPLHTSLKIWDILFYDGSIVLFNTTITYLKINQKEILKMDDFTMILMYLQDKCLYLFDYSLIRV
jgi:small G protein signaling modulator 3